MLRRLILLFFVFVAGILCSLAQDARSYYLPKTKFRFVLTIERSRYVPGEYSAFAAKYFKLKRIDPKAYDNRRMLNMRIEQVGVPDQTKLFNARNVGKLNLSNDGCLLAINTVPPPVVDIPEKRGDDSLHLDYSQLPYTEEMQQATTKAKVAQLIASEIYDIRSARDELLRKNTDKTLLDSVNIAILLDRMDRQESAYMKYFEGVECVDTIEQYYEVVPDGDIRQQLLFTFDDVPYYVSITDMHQLSKPIEQPELRFKDETGIWTNLPGVAHVSVYQADRLWTEYNFYVAQFGKVQNLGPSIISKKSKTIVLLNPATGAIRKIESLQ